MSVNSHKSHVFALPEDKANSQLAIGFRRDPSVSDRNIDVLDVAGGWLKVLETFKSVHVRGMDANQNRFMVLLIDFDGHSGRLERAKAAIPNNLSDRVFVLGVWTEPEELKRDLGSYETIGKAMAKDCREGTDTIWGHALLRHNASEIDRVRRHVRPILFQSI